MSESLGPEETSANVVSVVVPTFKEAENLSELANRIANAFEKTKWQLEIIIVDDNSMDGSDRIVQQLSDVGLPIQIIVRKDERGLSSAVIRGFQEATGNYLVCMDADLSHPPETIPRMISILEANEADFVIGSRYVAGGSTHENWSVFRWLNSKVATLLARPFTRARDPMAGFFALKRSLFQTATSLNPVGYKIALELIVKCRCKTVEEVPIHFSERLHGSSKLSLKEQVNYMRHIKRLADFKFGVFSQLAQFCFVGGTGVLVDLTCYGIMLRLGVGLMGARASAIFIAMTSNFFMNRRITFNYSRKESAIRQYLRFLLTSALGAAISWSVAVTLSTAITLFRAHLFAAALVGIACGTVCNFIISLKWVFRSKVHHEKQGQTQANG